MTAAGDVALAALAAGLCVVPPIEGTKRPMARWKAYQSDPPTEAQVKGWYRNSRAGIGLVTGAVSGHLEMLDVEGRFVASPRFVDWLAAFQADLPEVAFGYVETTPSGGFHWLYRVEGGVGGNQVLARDADGLVLIETRGEGGYTVVAPTSGYRVITGSLDCVPTISAEMRARF